MMVHLDVLKFTPSPKKGNLESGIFGKGMGMGIVGICCMEMGFEPIATPVHGRTDGVYFCLAGLSTLW